MKHLLDTKVGPYQAMIPMVDVDTIGAGGGSIAYVDQGGIFRVGPRSAGADPGPAAYGRGGTEPTATDAMVNLGWLLAGGVPRRRHEARADLARKAFEEGPAQALGMTVEEASMGAVQILTHSMVQSIEENSVRKGYDPRDFALVAEGGAGPLFAAQIALEVGTPWVLVPPYPGVTAAMGLLATDMVYEYVSTVYQRLSTLDAAALERAFDELEEQARAQLEEDGVPADRLADPARRRLPLPRPGLRAARRRRLGRDRRRRGSRRCAPTSTTSTSASTRGASRSRTSRSRTSACAAIGLMPQLATPEIESGGESPDGGAPARGRGVVPRRRRARRRCRRATTTARR